MKLNSHTEWGNLQEIIVGNIGNFNDIHLEDSFFFYFMDNIDDTFQKQLLQKSLKIKTKFLKERQEDLDNLAKILKDMGITVYRPDLPPINKQFITQYFSDTFSPCDNPRDLVLILGNKIIETPIGWRRRYFETDLLKNIFTKYIQAGCNWYCAPRAILSNTSYDTSSHYSTFKIEDQKYDTNYEILFDAAQILRFGYDLVMNIANKNHYNGYMWLKNNIAPEYNIHPVTLTDHHIDGMFMPLRPGLLLINSSTMLSQITKLPSSLQNWDMIICEKHDTPNYSKDDLLLASENISVNVLVLSEKKVIIFNESGNCNPKLVDKFYKHSIDVIEVRLRHSRVFGGGLHCATLDTVRNDSAEYFL